MDDILESEPQCPTCRETMHPAQRMAHPARTPRLRVGSPVPPPRVLPVWRCQACGIDVPRIDAAA
jgi:ribosomal protein L37AE/L43A